MMNINVSPSDGLSLDSCGRGKSKNVNGIYRLTLPRYVPCVVEEANLITWYDCQGQEYVVICPECQRLISFDTLDALCLAMAWSERKCCQGCRAKITFKQNPGLIGVILDFWYRKDTFPQSPSWVEAIPQHQWRVWADQIQAGLQAATAPLWA
jgi:hypothetical protein